MGDGWIITAVAVKTCEAPDAATANALAKRSPAYRQICGKYPSATWEREYIGTERNEQIGFWMVSFRVRRRAPDANPK